MYCHGHLATSYVLSRSAGPFTHTLSFQLYQIVFAKNFVLSQNSSCAYVCRNNNRLQIRLVYPHLYPLNSNLYYYMLHKIRFSTKIGHCHVSSSIGLCNYFKKANLHMHAF